MQCTEWGQRDWSSSKQTGCFVARLPTFCPTSAPSLYSTRATLVVADEPAPDHDPDMDQESDEGRRDEEQGGRVLVPFLILGQDRRFHTAEYVDDGETKDGDVGLEPSPAEKILVAFFKCAGFPHKCAFYSHTCDPFAQHLESENHRDQQSFPCFYCGLECPTGPDLVQHMLLLHAGTRFQCNLCLYRTASDLHILSYHMDCHFDNWEASCNQSSSSSLSVHRIKRESFMGRRVSAEQNKQANASASANSGRDRKLQPCKVLVCRMPAAGPLHPLDTHFFDTMKKERVNRKQPADRNKVQCVYCPVMDANPGTIAAHCAHKHPHYPLLMYMPVDAEEQQQRPSAAGAESIGPHSTSGSTDRASDTGTGDSRSESSDSDQDKDPNYDPSQDRYQHRPGPRRSNPCNHS